MSNQTAAENAMRYARAKTGAYKTANKFFNEKDAPASFKRRYEASLYRGSIEREAPKLGATVDDIDRYAQRAMEVQAGNCGELAAIAYAYLLESAEASSFDYVIFASPGDHAFISIGQPLPVNGVYPISFGDWHDGAYICDPWANLACPAQEYPQYWQAKMRKWAMAGKRLGKPGDDVGKSTIVEATDAYWYDAPTMCNKISFMYKTGGKAAKTSRCNGCVIL